MIVDIQAERQRVQDAINALLAGLNAKDGAPFFFPQLDDGLIRVMAVGEELSEDLIRMNPRGWRYYVFGRARKNVRSLVLSGALDPADHRVERLNALV